MRLGTAVLVLPWHNPVLVAEQAATIDLLSGGRLDFGVGKGYRHNEFAGFCVPIEEADARFNESLDVIVKSWTSKQRFSHHGKYWNFEDIIVEPPTAQKPHPPIWMGAGSPDSIRQVAARGFNLLLDQFASFETVAERIAIFKAAVEERGRVFDPLEVGVARAFYVARDAADKEIALERRMEAQRRLAAISSRARRQEHSEHHGVLRHPRSQRRERALRHAGRDRRQARKIAQRSASNMCCSTAAAASRTTACIASPAK